MFQKLFRINLILMVCLVCCRKGMPQEAESKLATKAQPSWEVLQFGRSKDVDYHIDKIVITIPKNSAQKMLYGLDSETLKDLNFGPLKDRTAELTNAEITDRKLLGTLQDSFMSYVQLKSNGGSVYGNMGNVNVFTSTGMFTIGITERGFTLGTDTPTQKNVFFNWTLAKLIDQQVREQSGEGLKDKYFSLLSGSLMIERDRNSYEHAIEGKAP